MAAFVSDCQVLLASLSILAASACTLLAISPAAKSSTPLETIKCNILSLSPVRSGLRICLVVLIVSTCRLTGTGDLDLCLQHAFLAPLKTEPFSDLTYTGGLIRRGTVALRMILLVLVACPLYIALLIYGNNPYAKLIATCLFADAVLINGAEFYRVQCPGVQLTGKWLDNGPLLQRCKCPRPWFSDSPRTYDKEMAPPSTEASGAFSDPSDTEPTTGNLCDRVDRLLVWARENGVEPNQTFDPRNNHRVTYLFGYWEPLTWTCRHFRCFPFAYSLKFGVLGLAYVFLFAEVGILAWLIHPILSSGIWFCVEIWFSSWLCALPLVVGYEVLLYILLVNVPWLLLVALMPKISQALQTMKNSLSRWQRIFAEWVLQVFKTVVFIICLHRTRVDIRYGAMVLTSCILEILLVFGLFCLVRVLRNSGIFPTGDAHTITPAKPGIDGNGETEDAQLPSGESDLRKEEETIGQNTQKEADEGKLKLYPDRWELLMIRVLIISVVGVSFYRGS